MGARMQDEETGEEVECGKPLHVKRCAACPPAAAHRALAACWRDCGPIHRRLALRLLAPRALQPTAGRPATCSSAADAMPRGSAGSSASGWAPPTPIPTRPPHPAPHAATLLPSADGPSSPAPHRPTGLSTGHSASGTSLPTPSRSRSPSSHGGCASMASRQCSRTTRWTGWSVRRRLPAGQGDRCAARMPTGAAKGRLLTTAYVRSPNPTSGDALPGIRLQEVMDSMYGRSDPKPLPALYSVEERAAMRREAEAGKVAARLALQQGGPTYATLELPPLLGLDCQRYKWRQNQSHVEVFVPLPEGLPADRVVVQLRTAAINVWVDEAPVLAGRLFREIKAEESTWYIQDGVLEIVMLKRCRRGHYETGKTNAGATPPGARQVHKTVRRDRVQAPVAGVPTWSWCFTCCRHVLEGSGTGRRSA